MKRSQAITLTASALSLGAVGRPARAEAPDVVIGSILPLTGPLAPSGQAIKIAQELARDLINGHVSYPVAMVGHSGLPNLGHARLRLIFVDSQGKPDQAKTVAEQLINSEKVVAILGAYTSASTATASQVAERYGVPYLTPTSAAPNLHERGLKTFFRTTPHDGFFSQNLFDFMAEMKKKRNLNIKRIAIVHEDTLFGTGSGDAENTIAKREGYEVVLKLPYNANTSEVQSEVQRIKASNADVVMMTSYIADAILYMKTFKEQNYMPQAIIGQNAGFNDAAFVRSLGKDANFIYSRETYSNNIKNRNEGVPLINELYKQRSGGAILDGNAARDFTGVTVLADAINRAGSTKPDAIIKALHATNIPGDRTIMPWTGVKFDAHGQNTGGKGIVVQVINGIYETVWPFEVASKPAIWPIPGWNAR